MRRSFRSLALTLAALPTAAVVAFCTSTPGLAATPPRVQTTSPSGAAGSWKIKFDDEFTSPSIQSSKWNTGWFGNGVTQGVNQYEIACYDSANLQHTPGALRMLLTHKAQTCGGKRQPYSGSLMTTLNKFEFTYGFAEARVWVAGIKGKIVNLPAFWINGHTWPNDGEIDLFESDHATAAYHVHWGTSSSAKQSGSAVTGNFSGWHTFGVDWEPGGITFYYDGHVAKPSNTTAFGRNPVPGGLVHATPHYLILGNSTGPTPAPVTTASMFVDYVRVWQH